MPVISMFYGLIIRRFFFDADRHHVPHIHVEFGELNAVFCIEDGEILVGELPRQKVRLVQAWIELHREELLADWKLAMEGSEVFRIEPLR
ncbi:MAG: DUF4160 domain-containing protein [Magnetococcales bacterium]|nr:DUF4160 domain-containing protein [Magnetococcales bacterium]MBF0323260.1 DUF4160 domain-containing protein [Magnetococcales bacterium]